MSDKNSPSIAESAISDGPLQSPDESNQDLSKLSDASQGISISDNDFDSSDAQNEAEKMQDLKSTLLDSAELATRGASLAVKAGVEMHQAADKLMASSVTQQKFNKITLLAFGATMTIALVLFVVMAFRMQSKITQLDAMVLAVGKRVVTMDASIELVSTASDLIKDFSIKQDALTNAQVKLESKIDESMKAAHVVPDPKLKPAEDVNKEYKLLFQNLESKIQAQANSIKSISSQIQKLQASLPDPNSFKRELEAASRLLKERQVLDAAPIASPSVVKPREKIVQFPRIVQPANGAEKP
jgi:hypothetical protein